MQENHLPEQDGREDAGIKEEKNNLCGFIFGARGLELESRDILSKMF